MSNPEASEIITSALEFLASRQQADGSFTAYASKNATDFSRAVPQPTAFHTALIATALTEVPESKDIRRRASAYLLSQAGAQWTWNYWERDSEQYHKQPYPDDLDDTSVALAALHATDPSLITSSIMGSLAQHLIKTERRPGGPYRTWILNDRNTSEVWLDIDIAVNANVGYLLHRLEVRVPKLETYLTKALQEHALISRYYCGEMPIMYFISRWYRGTGLTILRQRILETLHKTNKPLEIALGLRAAHSSGVKLDPILLSLMRTKLLAAREGNHWKAEALYDDPPVSGTHMYAGSDALTTAFAIEALASSAETLQPKLLSRSANCQPSPLESEVQRIARTLPGKDLGVYYLQAARGILKSTAAAQITSIAETTSSSCNQKLADKTALLLNAGSLNGWIAYTFYDDMLDGDSGPETLAAANIAHRLCIESFRNALPGDKAFQEDVQRTLDRIDAANAWELAHARANLTADVVSWKRLPDYKDLSQLAHRSLGHSLAPQGSLIALGFDASSPELRALKMFFHHFLIARQLNDDAHDWENDLTRGHISAVVALLLQEYTLKASVDLKTDLVRLRVLFWEQVCDEVVRRIREHARKARLELAKCGFTDISQYESWLQALEDAALTTETKRNEARKFMDSYAKTPTGA